MDIPRLFKCATPDLVKRKVFRIVKTGRKIESEEGPKESIELTINEPMEQTSETSSDTTTATSRADNPKVPVLAIGTYHRKEAAPILATAATRFDTVPKKESTTNPLPHPADCVAPSSNGEEMFQQQQQHHRSTQGPPPAWQPPIPPGFGGVGEHDYTNDYEDPEELARHRDGSSNLLIKTTTPPPHVNNNSSYEMSLSQQRRSQQQQMRSAEMSTAPPFGGEWPNSDGTILHKNAEGAYYIPSGSLRTTSSTLSPASGAGPVGPQRYHEQPPAHHGVLPANVCYSDATSTLLKYPLTGTQQNRRRQVSSMNNNNHHNTMLDPNASIRKKKKLDDDDDESATCWRRGAPSKCTLLLASALILAIFVILFMLFKSPSYVYTEPSPSAELSTRYAELGIRALPPAISLGERVDVEFFPRHMATTELILSRSARIMFNATVGSGAQLVMLIRAGVPPSMSLHDGLFSIRADRIREMSHIVEEMPAGASSRSRRNIIGGSHSQSRQSVEIMSPRIATYEQFLLEGRHFLTFINERNRIEPISFIAQHSPRKPDDAEEKSARHHPLTPVCDANCNNRGECVMGKCQCAAGYTGKSCEDAICPVVCSGNGIFSGGACICKAGFKGKECEMRATWCETPDCNGRGRCDANVGRCRCDARWTGDACELRACPHPTCTDRGICSNGTCYCQEGWRGDDCSMFADAIVQVRRPVANREVVATTTKSPILATTSRPVATQMTPETVKTCMNNGKLVDDECLCAQGFSGTSCETKACASCVNGDCVNGKCLCWKGFGGKSCDSLECAQGCETHGKCLKNGTCQCEPGWNGDNCYTNGCPNQCSNRGECRQGGSRGGEWSCHCQTGQTGEDCSLAVEMHCDDSLDNDNDGLVDCDDPECCSHASCAGGASCSMAVSPTDVLLRMPPVFNANFSQRSQFLIMSESVQSYAQPWLFNATTMAVIRGRIMWRAIRGDDSPMSPSIALPGVRVSDSADILYGFTLSRSDGFFDLLVNGARSVHLSLLHNQFKPVKINVYVPPGQITIIDDVVLHRTGSLAPPMRQVARPKCSPTLRRIPDVTIVSNWQYARDGVDGVEARLLMDTRSIFEALPIQGTDLRLVYDSARCVDAPATMLIGLLGEHIDAEIRRVHLNLRIAGREFAYRLAPRVNLTHIFTWDKMNAYRQSETGLVAIDIRVGYEYAECDRDAEIVWIARRSQMLGAVARKMIGNAWTLDVHHHLDIVNNIVEKGDGGYKLISELEPLVSTIAGIHNVRRDIDCSAKSCDTSEPFALFRPTSLVYAFDGSLIIGDHNLIRRVDVDGNVRTILELSVADTSHSYYLAASPVDKSLVISLPLHKQIWRIVSLEPQDAKTNYEIVAGDGAVCGSAVDGCGDGGLAQNAQLIFPKGVAFDRNGNLYFADSRRIRVIDTTGHIRSIGEPTPDSHPHRVCATRQMTKLVDLQMEWPTAIAIDAFTNAIYILDTNVVYEIDGDVVRTVLGHAATCATAGDASANHTALQSARDISVAPDGSLYVVESDGKRLNQIRKLSADRATFAIVAGAKTPCSCDVAACGCDNEQAIGVSSTSGRFNSPHAITVAVTGELVVADTGNAKIRKIVRRSAKYVKKTRHYEVMDGERMEKLVFNRHGLHTATISMLSGRALLNFTYTVDSSVAQLATISGSNGMSLRFNRPNETELELVTSRGVQTLLSMSSLDGTLEQVLSRPASLSRDTTKFAYTKKRRLLASRVDVASAATFEYDATGRAEAISRDRETWRIGRETIQIGGRVTADIWLNEDRRWSQVRMSDGDLAMSQPATRLITLRRDGYTIQSPFGTSSLFDTTIPRGFDEPVVSRRRTTVPAINDPQRRALTTRWDWRYVFKTSDDDADANASEAKTKRVAEINGVNIFSMEYNIANNRDTLRLGSTFDESSVLLNIDYSSWGEIRKIWTPADAQLDELTIDDAAKSRLVKWGKWRVEKKYDSLNRLVEILEDGGRVALKLTYANEKRRNPTTIQRDTAKWTIQYDNFDRVKEVVNDASGESTQLSAISLGAREWVLKRQSSLNTRAAMLRLAATTREIEEYATPDGLHHFMRQRDADGRVARILNDGATTSVECWAPDGTLACVRHGKEWKMNLTWQGHLVARKSMTMFGKSSSFSYEYDDLLRPIAIQPVIEQSVVEPIHISYDERTGRVASLNAFAVISDATTTRCQGHGMTYETSRIDAHRQIVEVKLIAGDVRAKLSIRRDNVGRAERTRVEVESSGFSKNVKVLRSFDGTGRLASVEQGEAATKTHLGYNSDGRVEKVNDRIVEYHRGGALKLFIDTTYTVDSIGWVVRRDNVSFAYDAKGRLTRAGDYVLTYDHEDRLIVLRHGQEMTLLYYADIRETRRVTHYSRDNVISTIFYDENSLPFAISSSDGRRYGVVCDETRTPRVVATESRVVRMIERDTFGRIRRDESFEERDERFWMPIGYLGGVELDGIDVAVLDNGRPMDLISGRYLSVSPEAVRRVELMDLANSVDLLALETQREPFALPRIPEDFESWFKLVGLSTDLLPNIHLGLSPTTQPVTHRLLNAFPKKLDALSHVNTIRPSRLVNSESRDSQLVDSQWSIEDVGFSNLLIINTDSRENVTTRTLPLLNVNESLIVHQLLDGARHVAFNTWSPVPVRHFWKAQVATLNSESWPHFTLVVNKESVELRNGKSKIIVHIAKDEKEVIKKLTDDLRSRESISVWKAERKRLDSSVGAETWHKWTDRERRELKSKGTVSGYTVDTRPTHHAAFFATIHSWKFVTKN